MGSSRRPLALAAGKGGGGSPTYGCPQREAGGAEGTETLGQRLRGGMPGTEEAGGAVRRAGPGVGSLVLTRPPPLRGRRLTR